MFLNDGMGNARRAVSAQTAEAIDQEVKEIVETAHQQALDILKANRELLETITQKLLENEVVEGETLHKFLAEVRPLDKAAAVV